jgi:hypothetical protein
MKNKIKIIFYSILVNVLAHVEQYIYNVYNIGSNLKLINKLLDKLYTIISVNSNAKYAKPNFHSLSQPHNPNYYNSFQYKNQNPATSSSNPSPKNPKPPS